MVMNATPENGNIGSIMLDEKSSTLLYDSVAICPPQGLGFTSNLKSMREILAHQISANTNANQTNEQDDLQPDQEKFDFAVNTDKSDAKCNC